MQLTAGGVRSAGRAMAARGVNAGDLALVVGILLMAVPVLLDLAREEWITDQGSQGPIMLALGLWLTTHEWRWQRVASVERSSWWGWLALLLIAHVAARVTGQLWLAWVTVVLAGAFAVYLRGGVAALRRIAFPLLFFALLVPPPGLVTGPVIDQLNPRLAEIAIGWFRAAGFEATSSGTMLYLGPYEMQITDACAGMGSLLSLVAIGLLYLHLRYPGRLAYALAMVPLLLMVAVGANLLRIALLMLVTVEFGDSAAQGWFHPMAGLILFALALGGVMLVDAALMPMRSFWARRSVAA